MTAGKSGRGARVAIGALWLFALLITVAAGLELALKLREQWKDKAAESARPRYTRLEHAYACDAQDLHPQYFFFFPGGPRERVALSNDVCTIDADGFRGPGPAHAGGRRLAFLVGGSAAFGLNASSDATTITGYLNHLQADYHFVNAGFIGWNSTQELYRVALQVVDYHPALVIAYDGANDATLLRERVIGPANFVILEDLVRRNANQPMRRAVAPLVKYLFPELLMRIYPYIRSTPAAPDLSPVADGVLAAGAARYLSNLARMHELTRAQGGRFVGVFQPVAALHKNIRKPSLLGDAPDVEGFHRLVMKTFAHDFEFQDMGSVLDRDYTDIPVLSADLTDDVVFLDQVHLYDPGNLRVARHLLKLLSCQPGGCT